MNPVRAVVLTDGRWLYLTRRLAVSVIENVECPNLDVEPIVDSLTGQPVRRIVVPKSSVLFWVLES